MTLGLLPVRGLYTEVAAGETVIGFHRYGVTRLMQQMRYRVMFMERTDAAGNPSEDPTGYLIPELESGVVKDVQFIERDKPAALHSEDRLEEDDDFLSVGSEVWEYDIAPGRDQDFVDALVNSQMVLDYEVIDETQDSD